MPRSASINTRKRRKSPRLQNEAETSQPVIIEGVARARRRSGSSSSSSSSYVSSSKRGKSSYHHQRLGDNGTDRALRSRKSASSDDDRKISSQMLNDSTNADGNRKRTASSASSSKKKNPRVSISTEPAALTHQHLTRLQRQIIAKQVTPSPASQMNATSNFKFNSPLPKRRLSASSPLPEGVIDLYPSKEDSLISPTNTCRCGQDDCCSHELSASFIQSYGKEYWTKLKEREEPAIKPPSLGPLPLKSTSAIASIPSSPSSVFSDATPDQRRDFVYIDTSNLEARQPRESNLFLHYQPELTPKMRAILVDWIIELSEHFQFGPSTLHLAVTLVDKVLACGPLSMYDDDGYDSLDDGESKTNCFLISRDRFQLLGAVCTWVACKVEEISPPSVSEIAYVSDSIYTNDQIKRMERRICIALNFSIIHQTPYLYIHEIMRASNECPHPSCESSSVFHNLVLYLLELGRLPYGPVTKKPSLLAASAVYLARVTLGIQSQDTSLDPVGRWSKTLQYYSGYSLDDLKETVLAIHGYYLASEETLLKSVFAKYRHKKYHRVALKTVPRVEDLGF